MYFSSYLPKLLLSSLPLSGLGFLLDPRIRSLLIPYLAFIGIISGLAHKEWRFVIYVVPAFNIAAARSHHDLVVAPLLFPDHRHRRTSGRKGSVFGQLCFLAVVGMLVLNAVATFLSTQASAANYPGGTALYTFNDQFSSEDSGMS